MATLSTTGDAHAQASDVPLSGMLPRPTFDDLDELAQRGRVFYEMFPGAPASDAWRAAFAKTHSPDGSRRSAEPRTH